jgi:hypothetical protein
VWSLVGGRWLSGSFGLGSLAAQGEAPPARLGIWQLGTPDVVYGTPGEDSWKIEQGIGQPVQDGTGWGHTGRVEPVQQEVEIQLTAQLKASRRCTCGYSVVRRWCRRC